MTSEWQDIATAPMDGTTILFVADGKVHAGVFHADSAPFPWVFLDDPREVLVGCCDHEMEGRAVLNGYPLNMPTHWLPLPEPPK